MASKKIGLVLLALCLAAGLGYVYVSDRNAAGDSLKIYGSVDMRTVDLAFEESGRIGQVLVEEGDTVKTVMCLPSLTMSVTPLRWTMPALRLKYAKKNLICCLPDPVLKKLMRRRATYKANAASAALAQRICKRERKLGQATTEQMVDQACSQARVSQAQALASKKNLDLLLAGTRIEQIDVARAKCGAGQDRP